MESMVQPDSARAPLFISTLFIMPDKDQISQEAAQEKSVKEKVGTALLKPIRAPLGALANVVAKMEMLGNFESHKGLTPPYQTQLSIQTMDFKPKGGSTQQIEGWVMPPANPGNPTMVFFGGSDFDRADENYEEAITNMANKAKEQGMGFAVFDYPEKVNENIAKQFVTQVQDHLHDKGMPLNSQAYAGYSQGSFLATYAAETNKNAAGLHITSGFSSGRMAQKEQMGPTIDAMLEEQGWDKLKGIDKLIEKSQLTEVWDNMPLAEKIAERRDQQPESARMPISAVYDTQEDFGNENNRHMTPLIAKLNGTTKGVDVETTSGVDHLDMLKEDQNIKSFERALKEAKAFVNNPDRVIQKIAPVQEQQPSVREMLRNAASKVSNTLSSAKESVQAKLGMLSDQQKLERVERQIEKRQNHSANLTSQFAALKEKGIPAERTERNQQIQELQQQYDPTHAEGADMDIAMKIDDLKLANKLDDKITQNATKVQDLEKKQAVLKDRLKPDHHEQSTDAPAARRSLK